MFFLFFLPRKDWKDNSKRGWDRGKENFRFFFLLSHRFLISVTTLLFGSSTIPTFIHRTILCVPKKLHCVYLRILNKAIVLYFFHKTYIECTFETLFQFTVTQNLGLRSWFVKSVKMAKLSYDHVIKYVA